ncbi:MAG: cation transporter, partial [Solobacterium sp.]|nr:cation transporter [Solobacterium sp.]
MTETAKYKYEITGIDCADCAAKLEEKIKTIDGIRDVSLSFIRNSLSYECDHDEGKRIEEEMRAIVSREEPDAAVISKGHTHNHHDHEEDHDPSSCGCQSHPHDHEHHDHDHEEQEEEEAVYRFEITGIDCADCAAKLEEKIKTIDGIRDVSLSFIRNSLSYECDHDEGKRI